MKKILTVVALMFTVSSQAYDIHQYDTNSQNSGYQSDSGNRYQYDMSNGNDRLKYSTDLDAQQRDYNNNMYNTSSTRQQDRNNGQYGGGIYNNDDD